MIFVFTGFALTFGSIYDNYLHPKDSQGYQQDYDVIGSEADFDILGHQWVDQGLEIFLRWDRGENEVVTGIGEDSGIKLDVNTGFGVSPYNTITLDFAYQDDFSMFDGRYIRFAFTCGNDVLAPASVPEPSTMVLFGLGLIGLAGLGRWKLKKSKDSLPKLKP